MSRGKYDEAYIDYLIDLLRVLKKHDFRVCAFHPDSLLFSVDEV
jgi:hypothetical protein